MGAARSKKALTRAVEEKDIKGMVACVGKLGKDVQVELKWFSLPLIAYCAHCDFVEGVTWLIEEGADVNALGENHTTALHRAKSAAVVNALLAAGADVDARNSAARTPLDCACYCDCEPAVSALLAAGATVDTVNDYGRTPLIEACVSGTARVVELLLAAGASTTVKDEREGKTAEEWAVERDYDSAIAAVRAAPAAAKKRAAAASGIGPEEEVDGGGGGGGASEGW
eukprot:PLAT13702.1.p1 GENE.PLAT13702.1~~PLAT13702.1.p1  ORF type:complete len:227 (-),score=38.70 PLAT13702.1:38-718(-)